MTPADDELQAIARRYRRFAAVEARGASPAYERLALAVARSPDLLAFLRSVPPDRRQPNLFLAALRHLGGVPRDARAIKALVRTEAGRIRDIMLSRTTQTNEPARCAVLLPVLADLRQPLALIEVGASAGLCLLPDLYGYDYGRRRLEPPAASVAPVFSCRASPATPLPAALPKVAWRCGLDLNPLDVNAPEQMAWLETLIWPGCEVRRANLKAALCLARAQPPSVVRGDLGRDLAALIARAPTGVQLVVYHSAVLAYLPSASEREAFARSLRLTDAVWISNEPAAVFPELAKMAPPPQSPDQFLLAVDGKPVAWTGPHGQSITWFAT
jgi:hypothetical protein